MLVSRILATLALAATAIAKLKIMPLGDSITEITCWRTMLWDSLASARVTSGIEFVGSMTNNPENCVGASGSNWDHHHEGHSGYLAINIANNNLQGWLANTKPDIVMFMLGTNDVNGGRATADIMAAYTKMVQLMRAANPNVKIIVDKVIPLPYRQSGIDAINAQIPSWASSHSTTQSPIKIADCATGFSTSWLRDGVHPNSSGDTFIAKQIYPVLLSLIQASLGGGSTAATTTTTAQGSTTTTPASGNCAAMWGQCGGIGWTGPTCCSSGTCTVSNQWYSQCI